MSNETLNPDLDTENCSLTLFTDISVNVEHIIVVSGFLTNVLCVLVFAKILFQRDLQSIHFESNMFKYLFVKSIFDTCFFVFDLLDVVFQCKSCAILHIYFMQVWHLVFYTYGKHVCELCSAFLDILATFDCLILINDKQTCCRRKLFFYASSITLFIFSGSYYVCYFFRQEVVPVKNSSFTEDFTLILTPFGEYKFSALLFIHTLLRDMLSTVLLLVLEGLILQSLRKTTQRRSRLTSSQQHQQCSPLVAASVRAERSRTILILLVGTLHLCHLPILVHDLPINSKTASWKCFHYVARALLKFCYAAPFFLYLCFNTAFKRCFIEGFRKLSITKNRVDNSGGTNVTPASLTNNVKTN